MCNDVVRVRRCSSKSEQFLQRRRGRVRCSRRTRRPKRDPLLPWERVPERGSAAGATPSPEEAIVQTAINAFSTRSARGSACAVSPKPHTEPPPSTGTSAAKDGLSTRLRPRSSAGGEREAEPEHWREQPGGGRPDACGDDPAPPRHRPPRSAGSDGARRPSMSRGPARDLRAGGVPDELASRAAPPLIAVKVDARRADGASEGPNSPRRRRRRRRRSSPTSRSPPNGSNLKELAEHSPSPTGRSLRTADRPVRGRARRASRLRVLGRQPSVRSVGSG